MSPSWRIHILVAFVSPVIASTYASAPDVHEGGSQTWCLPQLFRGIGAGFRAQVVRSRFRIRLDSGVFLLLVRNQFP